MAATNQNPFAGHNPHLTGDPVTPKPESSACPVCLHSSGQRRYPIPMNQPRKNPKHLAGLALGWTISADVNCLDQTAPLKTRGSHASQAATLDSVNLTQIRGASSPRPIFLFPEPLFPCGNAAFEKANQRFVQFTGSRAHLRTFQSVSKRIMNRPVSALSFVVPSQLVTFACVASIASLTVAATDMQSETVLA